MCRLPFKYDWWLRPRLLCPESDWDAASSTTTSNEDVSQIEHSLITGPMLEMWWTLQYALPALLYFNLYRSESKRQYQGVVNFFLVEAETRRRWDIFQAEVTLYWELAVRRCSHPSLNLKWLYKVIYRHFWRRDSWRWRQFSNKASQHNQMHRN